MNDVQQIHPTDEHLVAFAQGRLAEPELSEVHGHLADCDACRTKAEAAGDDTLVALLRKADTQATEGNVADRREADTIAAAGATTSTGSALPADLTRHGRYRVQELLGVGGMGAVYKAEHLLMERPVALKLISHALTSNPAMIERFRREVKTAGQLKHPNIVMAYDAEQAGDSHFLVMEYVEGQSLARVVADRGPLPVREACEYIRQAALGLQHAHDRGMVHRDIKPQNLMLTPDGQVKILDFGLARFAMETAPALPLAALPTDATDSLTQVGIVMGTPDYIAPEQASDAHKADIRADIYSLGCTLYDLLAGHAPFADGGTVMSKVMAHMERAPQPLSEVRKDVPAELARVVERMMAKDPAKRYQTPAAVADALAAFTDPHPHAILGIRWVGGAWTAIPFVLAILLVLGYFYGAATYRIVTNRGQLVVTVDDDPEIEVVLKGTGLLVRDRTTGQTYEVSAGPNTLKAGDYELRVTSAAGLEVFAKQFAITRNGKTPIRVTWETKVAQAPSDHQTIQGVWKAVSGESDRKAWTIEEVKETRLVFHGESVHLTVPFFGSPLQLSGAFTLDPSKSPGLITLIGEDAEEYVPAQGIYRIEGDRLTVCLNKPGVDRPTEFETRKDKGDVLLVLERDTKADAKIESAKMLAAKAAAAWFKLKAAGDYGKAWEETAAIGRKAISKEDFAKVYQGLAKKLGKLKTQKMQGPPYYATELTGMPPGEYVILEYRSNFEKWANVLERITLMHEDGRWRIAGYFQFLQTIPPPAEAVSRVVRAGRDELTKEERADLEKRDPNLAEMLVDPGKRRIVDFFASLPERARKDLLKEGYLKWKFASLDPALKKTWREAHQRNLDEAKKLGVEIPEAASLTALEKADTGFALVNVPGQKTSVVSWYVLFPAYAQPGFAVVVGAKPDSAQIPVWAEAHVIDLNALRTRPYSKSIAESAKEDARDEVRLQGTWHATSASVQGQQMPELFLAAIQPTITFKANKVTWKANPKLAPKEDMKGPLAKFNLDGVFSVDATRSPPTIDMTVLGKDPKTPLGTPAPRALLGIYRLEGDTLEICIAIDPDQPEDRPTRFESVAGKWIAHVVLRRAPAGGPP